MSSIVIPGTGAWLARHCVYRDWLQSVSSTSILVHGVRGCGKSSIFSVVVDQLLSENQSKPRKSACAYYYCTDRSSEPDRACPDAILRCILRQLAVDQEKQTVAGNIWSVYKKLADPLKGQTSLTSLGRQECVELIIELTSSNTTFLALDAIDELRQEDRAELIVALHRIVEESAGLVKVFVTSRNNAQIEGLLQSTPKIRVSIAENHHDIKAFIAAKLEAIVHSRRLLSGQPSQSLLEKIQEALITGAQEM